VAALTDADLLHRYLSDRDETAFAAIVRKHGPMVFGACRRITAHHHDAEDAFQAAFLVLAARADVVRPAAQLGAWLHGVAVRCARKARDARRRTATSDPLVEPVVLPSAVEPDLPAHIDAALVAIPDAYRAAVVLCHLEGRSRSEAARELGWSEGTLSGRLHRALELLGRRLAARGVTATGAAVLAVLSARTASAGVPAALSGSTQTAASLLSAGFDQPAGSATALAHGVMRAMSFRKLKLAVAVLLGVTGLGSYAAWNPVQAHPPRGLPVARRNAPVPAEKKQTWKELFAVKHAHAVTAVASNLDLLAVGDEAGGLKLWETKAGAEYTRVLNSKEKNGKPVIALRFTPDAKWLFLAAEDGEIVARTDVTQKAGKTGGIGGPQARYTGFSADGLTWVEQDRPHLVLLRHSPFDLNWQGEPYTAVEEPDGKAIAHTSLSADDKVFALASEVPVVRVFDRGTNRESHKITLKEGLKLSALNLSDDGKRLAVIGEKGFAKVFDADNGAELCELKGLDGTVNAVAFTPDGSQVATACGKVARVFDARSGKLLGEIQGHDDEVTCLAFAADGKRLVTGSKDKTAKVWEVK
jgi:RNA polymerase sigma factor (sigma-70 family)